MNYNLPMSYKYKTVHEIAQKWQIAERTVRHYCSEGRIPGAILEGKTWLIPSNSEKPARQPRHTKFSKKDNILSILKREKESQLKGGIYHYVQIALTYNSNHIEGSKLTEEQTRHIFETKTIGITENPIEIDDIVETINHFRCVDLVIESAKSKLTESFIKQLHLILKTGTTDSQKSWFKVGGYKLLENEVANTQTAKPKEVATKMKELIQKYNSKTTIAFEDILDFHVEFEKIHPFQDGNGRVGRLIMFKECLKHNIVPFIITDQLKLFYYRGISEWHNTQGYLTDTCLTAQDEFKLVLERFGIKLEK